MSRRSAKGPHGKLGQLSATAICGNDITSSCLYVSALTILAAGKWAPVSLLMVAAVLFLFRSIYAEVVGAIPLNGGAYNALLNTTSKYRASVAACLTILSYMATAVISASTAIYYLQLLWPHDLPPDPIASGVTPNDGAGPVAIGATIGILACFMVLTILGIAESAIVAIGIFITHMICLCLLILIGLAYIVGHGTSTLMANFYATPQEGLIHALFLGFAAGMLGVSGFESSANFVEEQKPGVFPKTLRNMWIAVTVFNPAMALLALAILPIGDVESHGKALLAHMGLEVGGTWLSYLISIDAALVLSGAVLTSYVGVNGLVHRMTLDRCLPQFLLKTNRRGTTHRIIVGFFLLNVSILLITRGEIKALAGVYTLSFLSVMVLFALGNILLKVKRARLPHPSRAAWPTVLIGIGAVILGLIGNYAAEPTYGWIFLQYFGPAILIIMIMLGRITILQSCLFMVRRITVALHRTMGGLADRLREKIDEINAQQIVFFTRGDNVANLNNAVLYVQRNEHTNRIKVVTIVNNPKEVPDKLKQDIEFLDEAYPSIDIEFVILEGTFTPRRIEELSKKWQIPTNLMFIGSPGKGFRYDLAELRGVRLII